MLIYTLIFSICAAEFSGKLLWNLKMSTLSTLYSYFLLHKTFELKFIYEMVFNTTKKIKIL